MLLLLCRTIHHYDWTALTMDRGWLPKFVPSYGVSPPLERPTPPAGSKKFPRGESKVWQKRATPTARVAIPLHIGIYAARASFDSRINHNPHGKGCPSTPKNPTHPSPASRWGLHLTLLRRTTPPPVRGRPKMVDFVDPTKRGSYTLIYDNPR